MSRTPDDKSAAYFSIDILFSESLDFNLEEVAKAVSEDYPQAAVAVHAVNKGKSVRTDKVVLGMLKPLDPRNGHVVVMNGIGHPDEEFRAADHSEIAWRSGAFAHCAMDAIRSHQSYMTLSVQTNDHSLRGQFRAVRQLMAVSAVFAELPICLGILVHWSSHMVAPGTWVKGVQKSVREEWPVSEWLSFRCGWDGNKNASNGHAVGYTKGLRNFLGYELHVAAAPIQPSDAKLLLRFACLAILQGNATPRDGDTFGLQNNAQRYKVHKPQNANGTLSPVMILMHPEAPESHKPQEVVNLRHDAQRPAADFMKTLFSEHTASN